ncbi:MAG: hypothetical protein CME61_09795, partial [Halobacteriovoraceae bacterium]|nr:hypothetical protein [Halobacteriovoraceae bacterium]
LYFYNRHEYFNDILQYIYNNYENNIHNFTCYNDRLYSYTEYRARRREKPTPQRIKIPLEDKIVINYEYNKLAYDINIDISIEKNSDGNYVQLNGNHDEREDLMRTIKITGDNKDILYSFLDTAISYCKEERKKITKTNNNSMLIYYYKAEYWSLLSKVPKRNCETVFLKENQREEIYEKIDTFLDEDTRDKYINYGIPYKNVYLIYGPPGTGKTSLIRSIASDFDCDLFILPIQKRMEDIHIIDAMTGINNMDGRDNKNKVIVMEDIDTIFDKRKDGDSENGITLQCLLNMLDGFTCVEGTLLFLTANRPELFDSALLRSGRVDHKIKLDYADKYQMKNMFESYFPDQLDTFDKFYNHIRHLKITTAVLQEFLFKHEGTDDILKYINEITQIVDNNESKNFEVLEDNKNFYS